MTDIPKAPLHPEELRHIHAYWRACNYLAVGMIYLRANPLLREPLKPEHIKNRLLGHWGSDPGQSLVWVHLNRLIKQYDLDVILCLRPGSRCAGDAREQLPRGPLLRDLSGLQPRCGWDAQVFPSILVPGRHREPLHAGNAGLHP